MFLIVRLKNISGATRRESYHPILSIQACLLRHSSGSQFLLKEVAPSVTEIQATTWYTHKIAPVWYWELLSGPILHLIHKRVLSHIKNEAEKV